ncbi:MAG: hypothetical protein IJ180_06955 [Bacteroidales bacterium]|nr:hypothetical protein [Bacteroidales bacterium]
MNTKKIFLVVVLCIFSQSTFAQGFKVTSAKQDDSVFFQKIDRPIKHIRVLSPANIKIDSKADFDKVWIEKSSPYKLNSKVYEKGKEIEKDSLKEEVDISFIQKINSSLFKGIFTVVNDTLIIGNKANIEKETQSKIELNVALKNNPSSIVLEKNTTANIWVSSENDNAEVYEKEGAVCYVFYEGNLLKTVKNTTVSALKTSLFGDRNKITNNDYNIDNYDIPNTKLSDIFFKNEKIIANLGGDLGVIFPKGDVLGSGWNYDMHLDFLFRKWSKGRNSMFIGWGIGVRVVNFDNDGYTDNTGLVYTEGMYSTLTSFSIRVPYIWRLHLKQSGLFAHSLDFGLIPSYILTKSIHNTWNAEDMRFKSYKSSSSHGKYINAVNDFQLDALISYNIANKFSIYASCSLIPVFNTSKTDNIHLLSFGINFNLVSQKED